MLSKQSVKDFEKKDNSDDDDWLIEPSQQNEMFYDHSLEKSCLDDNDNLSKHFNSTCSL